MTPQRHKIGSELVAALELAWNAIRRRHTELPDAVLIVGSGSEGPARGLRLGHFAASHWSARGGTLGEVFIAGEGLDRGAVHVLGTLLHEASHALAHEREQQDTSRQGRYHNTRFRRLAEEMGLTVEHHQRLGWSLTSVPDRTMEVYSAEISALDRAITAHRSREVSPTENRSPSRNATVALCGCGRRLRIAPGVLAIGPVLCGVCGQPFRAR
jgi:hypothetical protein